MTKMGSKRVWKPGDEAYFWLPKLAGENSPEKVIVCSELGEDGTYFVMWNPLDKDAWFIVNECELWEYENIPEERRQK
jgi:hypothetical protein